jgi:hypothetical protein
LNYIFYYLFLLILYYILYYIIFYVYTYILKKIFYEKKIDVGNSALTDIVKYNKEELAKEFYNNFLKI